MNVYEQTVNLSLMINYISFFSDLIAYSDIERLQMSQEQPILSANIAICSFMHFVKTTIIQLVS